MGGAALGRSLLIAPSRSHSLLPHSPLSNIMRSVVLVSSASEPLLSHARSRVRGEEFSSSVRDFLSLLAVADVEDLDYVQSKILPHRLALHRGPLTFPAHETSQATQNESPVYSHTTEGAQPSSTLPTMGGWQSYPAGFALRSPQIADSLDLFAMITSLEDQPLSHEQVASIDVGMPDREDTTMVPTANGSTSHSPTLPTSENASDTLASAADSNEPTNTIMMDLAETPLPGSFQSEPHTEFSSMSPSQASSNWCLSPVLDSMYA
ncbi:hypothetical protein FB567DRAFT_330237 [Paraphoma chrysanthemicola]|uniref:Uncharacterized protein n=1 Tax=Paraphoma chrysanthemicola TaxID=798071 RepID=A0A8K0VYK8_9PLEO|nr:hypothetical protein FB567DRAFT_330237 [Paraphoma chrysanthemicola]